MATTPRENKKISKQKHSNRTLSCGETLSAYAEFAECTMAGDYTVFFGSSMKKCDHNCDQALIKSWESV